MRVKEIRIRVEIPENNFNPNSIEAFNTSFTKQGSFNTVIESEDLDFKERTYVIRVDEALLFSTFYFLKKHKCLKIWRLGVVSAVFWVSQAHF